MKAFLLAGIWGALISLAITAIHTRQAIDRIAIQQTVFTCAYLAQHGMKCSEIADQP